jgi:CxC2 like cysteine cluster associated with KDZ transposases
MASRRAQWDQHAELAKAEMEEKTAVAQQKRTRTLTSQVMQGGQIVASSSQLVNNPTAQTSVSRRRPATTLPPAASPDKSIPDDEPNSSSSATGSHVPRKEASEFWAQFHSEKAKLADLLYHHDSDEGYGAVCTTCSSESIATVRCTDCWHRIPTCEGCFIATHARMPTHWAEVWSPLRGFTNRCDISALSSQPHIQLGHAGGPCPNSLPDGLLHEFIVVDINGVHNTRLRFCTCRNSDTPVAQLMKARLFPATFVKPRTAFTFAVLKQFHVLHLESAASAYSFIASLRRSTDSFFFNDASDPYDQFRDVFKMWKILIAEKRYGHHHGIDNVLVDRPPGHLTIGCPSCPEQNINTDRSVHWPKELQ